ncbi:MAG: DUF92 domain-containing protein [Chloroflexi bacterium]|nr:MAG: DUF92 domain-containing protein [Chloroflexota bacterium]
MARKMFVQVATQKPKARFLLGLLFSSSVALAAHRRHSLNSSGALGAITSGTTIVTMGGWSWGLSLIYFFISSSLLSHFREQDKARAAADKFSKGARTRLRPDAFIMGAQATESWIYRRARCCQRRHLGHRAGRAQLVTAPLDHLR